MKKTTRLWALLLAVLMIAALTGCGGSDAESPAPAAEAPAEQAAPAAEAAPAEEAEPVAAPTGPSDETLRVLITSEPANILPENGLLGDGQVISPAMYDTLLGFDDETNEIIPAVATEWEFIDDYHIRLKMRDDVVAYDGTILTANDVLFSVKMGMQGAAATFWKAVDLDECYVEDEFTFVLGLNQIYPTMIYQLANNQMLALLDESSMDASGGSNEMTVRSPKYSTGAYFFDEWKEGEYIRLVRNDNYWGGPGYYKYIEFRFNGDNASRVMALAAGETDFAIDLSSVDMQAVNNYDNCYSVVSPSAGVNVLYMNINNEYLSNKLVREAIYTVINAEAVNMIATGGIATIADGPYEHINPVYAAPETEVVREVNIEKAKALMAEAGYPDGGFSLRLPTVSFNQTVAEAVKADLAQLGIDVQVEMVEIFTSMMINDTGDFDLAVAQTFTDDPVNICNYIDDRMPLNERGGGIVGGLPESYDIIDRCRTASDADRAAAYAELQEFVRAEYLMVPFYDYCSVYGTNGQFDICKNNAGMLRFDTAVPLS